MPEQTHPLPCGPRLATLALCLLGWLLPPVQAAVLDANGVTAAQSSTTLAAQNATADLTDRLIIRYRSGSAAAQAPTVGTMARSHAAANRAGVQMSRLHSSAQGAQVMQLDQTLSRSSAQALAQAVAQADPDVLYAEPDLRLQLQFSPNDPSYASQWHYLESTAGLNAPAAWEKSMGTGVVVAVLDTGYRPHADLKANILSGGYDFVSTAFIGNDGDGRDDDPLDPGDWVTANQCGYTHSAANSSWHGTHVAGTIAAVTQNSTGVAGVAYGAHILPVRVLGRCGGYLSDIADAMVWAAGGTVSGVPTNTHPAQVISLSLGGTGSCGTTLQSAINSARALGATVVVAAGNSAANASTAVPANCSNVVTVAATNRSGGRAWYSNYGSVVDVAAPGGDTSASSSNGVLSTLNSGSTTPGDDSYAWYQGTSMATPHVSAAAALMLSVNPLLTPDQVEAGLKASARSFAASCSGCGAGLVDANAAVDWALANATSTAVAEVEPNDSQDAAQVVSATPASISGYLEKGSSDFYRFSVSQGSQLRALLNSPTTSRLGLYLYNNAGKLLAQRSPRRGYDMIIERTYSATKATEWVLEVRHVAGSAADYTLDLSH